MGNCTSQKTDLKIFRNHLPGLNMHAWIESHLCSVIPVQPVCQYKGNTLVSLFFKFKTPPSCCGFESNNPHPQKSPGLQLKHSIILLTFVSLYQSYLPPGLLPLDKAGDRVSWIQSPTTMTSSPSLITCAKNEDYKTVRRACGMNHSQENVSPR